MFLYKTQIQFQQPQGLSIPNFIWTENVKKENDPLEPLQVFSGILKMTMMFEKVLIALVIISGCLCGKPSINWRHSTSRKVVTFHPDLSKGNKEYAGMKMRLTKEGINYMNSIASKVVDEQIPKMKIPDMKNTLPGGKGEIVLSDIKIASFKSGKSWIDLNPPNGITWSMKDMEIRLTGNLGGHYVLLMPFGLSGMLDTTAYKVDFKLSSVMDENKDGNSYIHTTDCTAKIGNIVIHLHNGGLVGVFVNLLESETTRLTQPMLENELCRMTRSFLDDDLNNRLSKFPVQMPLSAASDFDMTKLLNTKPRKSSKNATRLRNIHSFAPNPNVKHSFSRDIMKMEIPHSDKLLVDYRLIRRPSVTSAFIETQHKGEISWLGQGKTPFGPTLIYEPPDVSRTAMLNFYLSDFVVNSMLYHTYRNRLLRFRITPNSEKLGPFMTTNCGEGQGVFSICMGDIVPGLAQKYPDHPVELLLSPTRAPALLFQKKNKGTALMDIQGVMIVFVRMPDRKLRQVLMIDAEVNALTKVKINGTRIVGKVRFDKFQFKVRRSSLPGTDDAFEVEEFQEFTSDVMQAITNGFLREGLPIPVIDGIKLIKSELYVYDRAIKIATDIEIEEKSIRNMAMNAMKN